MDNDLELTAPSFFRRKKKLKRVRFQIPGTKTNAQRNNLERHTKAYQNDGCALAALARLSPNNGLSLF